MGAFRAHLAGCGLHGPAEGWGSDRGSRGDARRGSDSRYCEEVKSPRSGDESGKEDEGERNVKSDFQTEVLSGGRCQSGGGRTSPDQIQEPPPTPGS